MRIFALGDLHLSFSGVKPMDVFGPWWSGHVKRVEEAWRLKVREEDVVCLPGDFSWAMRPSEVKAELDWLGSLPGTKVMAKGNHDYWWASMNKLKPFLPPRTHLIQGDAALLGGVAFGGARGWIDPTLDFGALSGHPTSEELKDTAAMGKNAEEDRVIYLRELGRLDASLSRMDPAADLKVAVLHYPPTAPDMRRTEVTDLLEKHGVNVAVFGHLHRSAPTEFANPFGERSGVRYYLASADFVDFSPVEIASHG